MTGKQIEETLERNAKNIVDGFDSEVLNYINRLKAEIERLNKSDTSKEDCTIAQHSEIKKLREEVKRLSEEHEDMYMQNHNLQTYINNHEEIWKRNAEIDKAIVRKETAKEILQLIDKNSFNVGEAIYKQSIDDDSNVVSLCGLKYDISKRYGVEVDNE